jgi:hypothetical protein
MSVVIWWAVLLIGSVIGFVFATRWALVTDLASVRERRMLRQLDREIEMPGFPFESSTAGPKGFDADRWWGEEGPRKAS